MQSLTINSPRQKVIRGLVDRPICQQALPGRSPREGSHLVHQCGCRVEPTRSARIRRIDLRH
jgi:hypothetical protein